MLEKAGSGSRSRAAALIVIVAVMGVLALLAVSFARLMRLERDVARRVVEDVEARFAAEAGVERGVAALRDQARDRAYVEPAPPWEPADPPGTPIESSLAPSFVAGVLPDGSAAYSGQVENDVAGRRSYYTVRVRDSARMIHLNSRYSETPPPDDVPVLARMLASLARAIDPANPAIDQADAVAILNYRDVILPGRNLPPRFANRLQLVDALVETGRMTEAQARAAVAALWDYVTCIAWPQAALDASRNLIDPSEAAYPVGFDRYPTTRPLNRPERPTVGQSIYKRDDLILSYGQIVPEARSPINVNTAPREVLIAALADIRAIYLDENITRTNFSGWSALPKDHNWYAIGIVREAAIDFAMAQGTADWIIANRAPLGGFRSWNQFNRFIDDAVIAGRFGSDGNEVFRGALVKANANPNNDLSIFNPNAVKYDRPVVSATKTLNDFLFRPVDKFMISAYTTEFSFDSMGYYEIESLGRVYGEDGEILAQHRIDTTVQISKIWHLTTQRDFTDGNGLGGSYEIRDATGGYSTPGGESLQIYPEPPVGGWPGACRFDGNIQRATLRADYSPTSQIRFYLPFETSYRAERAGGNPDMQPETGGPVLRSVLDPSILGGLFPDGMYAELDRSPAWFAAGNMPVSYNGPNRLHQGTVAFWFKPNWSISWSNKTHHLISASSNGTSDGDTLVFYIVYAGQYSGYERHLCFHSEGLRNGVNQRLISHAIEVPGHMWSHIAIVYDTGAGGNWDQPQQIFVNGVRVEPSHVRYGWDGGVASVDDPGYDAWGNPNTIRLGERPDRRGAAPSYEIPDGPLEGTLDEFLIIDRKLSAGEVQNLYRRGRFYPGRCEYSTPWVPADLFRGPVEIASVSWTAYLPTRDVFFPPASATTYRLEDYGVPNARLDVELLFWDGSRIKRKTDAEEAAEEGQPGDASDPGWTVGASTSQRFRVKLKFPNSSRTPLLQSEAIDDITVRILTPPRFHTWEVLP